MEFFERLYRGFEAEHYVAGKLFSIGYEAFMMPGDFGFDLMVTNQKERSKGPRLKGRLFEPPFAVQIKSRRLTSLDFRPSTSGRDEAEVSISIKKEDLDLLIGPNHSFLVIVEDEGDVVENFHLSFECFLAMRKLYLVKADWTLLHGIGDLGSE